MEDLGLYYFEKIITEELAKNIIEWYNTQEAKMIKVGLSKNSRKVLQYGYSYNYINQKSEKIEDIPPILQELINIIPNINNQNQEYNQCIINRYLPGQGIGAHIDSKIFGDNIACFTLMSGRYIEFTDLTQLYTEPNSLYIMTGDARYKYNRKF